MKVSIAAVAILTWLASPAFGQQSKIAADFARERKELAQACDALKGIAGCAHAIITQNPLHLAVGSLAPQNGFAFGAAFAERFTPNESWRLSWNADAVASAGGSWRGGLYMKMIHTPATSGVIVAEPGTSVATGGIAPREFAVVDVALQAISLRSIGFFGIGPASVEADRSFFAERQTIAGARAVIPLSRLKVLGRLHPAFIGGVTGRFIEVGPSASDAGPSIDTIYDDETAPGLGRRQAFLELEEAVRFKPSFAGNRLRLNYLMSAQQFSTTKDAAASFHRWSVDLRHEIPLYLNVSSTGPRDFNGPDECGQAAASSGCRPLSWSRNRQGTIGIRLVASTATASDGHRVPFYLQPTLGGSNLDGERVLSGYEDYRFRGPHLIALQESVEYAIWGPLGAFVGLEQGKVATARGDLNFRDLATSATVGITIRAGGAPLMTLAFAWRSGGHHVIADMGSTLLGGSARPPLF